MYLEEVCLLHKLINVDRCLAAFVHGSTIYSSTPYKVIYNARVLFYGGEMKRRVSIVVCLIYEAL